ncbi:hypothetical protein [Paraburkholderia tropica]|uniref:hypothetical protein n=1 Tax=Paraburkholderia tropica TaxID=92647 RepID=UPI0011B4CC01|nr:hypothetical protein [Paraburkholderia tropica]
MLKYVLLTAACAAAGYFSGAFAAHFPGDSSAWASWIQAVGSIVAILGAYYVGERQSRAALASVERGHTLAEQAKRRAILAIGEAAFERAQKIENVLKGERPRENMFLVYDKSIARSISGALSAIPLQDVGSREGVLAILDLRDQFVFLEQSMDAFLAGPWKHPELKLTLEEYKNGYPGYPNVLNDLLKTSFEALNKNVQVHIDEIRRRYLVLTSELESRD